MKKLGNIFLIFILVFSFSFNVLAEGEHGHTTGETTGETEEPKDPSDPDKPDNPETPTEPEKPTEKWEALLSNVKINDTAVECKEGSDGIINCKYTITKTDVKKAKVTFSKSEGATTSKESGYTIDVEEGTVDFDIKVTSKDENAKKTYKFIITKQSLSTDTKLKSLSVNGSEITLKDDTLKYTTSVSNATKKLEVKAIPSSDKAKVIDFKDNISSFDFTSATSKEIKIKVQAEDGQVSTYTLTVTKRGEADSTLKSLTIKNYKIDFSSEITDYELKVLKNVSKLDIEAKANDKNAKVKITNPSLQIGENTIKIEVTNDDSKTTYTIKVTKLNEDDKTLANLKSLKIDGYELDFSSSKYEYDLRIKDENYLKIKAETRMDDADVEITGNLDLVDGSIIKIRVNYDEDIYNVYKINIIKDGTVITKKSVNKKAAAAVIVFDVLSMIILGVLNLKEKLGKNNKNDNKKEEKKEVNKESKKSNINLEDDFDVI